MPLEILHISCIQVGISHSFNEAITAYLETMQRCEKDKIQVAPVEENKK